MSRIRDKRRKELTKILDSLPPLKDSLLAWHRKAHDDYEGFSTYEDYIKFGGMFIQLTDLEENMEESESGNF
tara:strand:- start:1098 stop:1313 length:216 start_codon:yes stop_codon:yes gene_type:complete